MEKKELILNVGQLDLNLLCCGCSACLCICPTNSITLKPNKHGFYNPVVNENCINCSKCLKVCQILKDNTFPLPIKFFACKSKNTNIRMSSSSGGMFYEICHAHNKIYGKNGIYWGAEWDSELNLHHSFEDIEHIDLFMGSKYVQSNLNKCFSEIGKQLIDGKNVLFSGTGCQCAGLRYYLNNKKICTDNLFLVDIICHGVPSSKIFQDYLHEIEYKEKEKVFSFIFRDKTKSWRGINPLITLSSGRIVNNDLFIFSYRRLFGNLILNECCHECKYTNLNRSGDITIGDYWGVEKYAKSLDDGNGVSVCLINSEKGFELFKFMQKTLNYLEIKSEQCLQPQLLSPTPRNIRHKLFWYDYDKHGYSYVANKYTKQSKLKSALRLIYNKIKGQ